MKTESLKTYGLKYETSIKRLWSWWRGVRLYYSSQIAVVQICWTTCVRYKTLQFKEWKSTLIEFSSFSFGFRYFCRVLILLILVLLGKMTLNFSSKLVMLITAFKHLSEQSNKYWISEDLLLAVSLEMYRQDILAATHKHCCIAVVLFFSYRWNERKIHFYSRDKSKTLKENTIMQSHFQLLSSNPFQTRGLSWLSVAVCAAKRFLFMLKIVHNTFCEKKL